MAYAAACIPETAFVERSQHHALAARREILLSLASPTGIQETHLFASFILAKAIFLEKLTLQEHLIHHEGCKSILSHLRRQHRDSHLLNLFGTYILDSSHTLANAHRWMHPTEGVSPRIGALPPESTYRSRLEYMRGLYPHIRTNRFDVEFVSISRHIHKEYLALWRCCRAVMDGRITTFGGRRLVWDHYEYTKSQLFDPDCLQALSAFGILATGHRTWKRIKISDNVSVFLYYRLRCCDLMMTIMTADSVWEGACSTEAESIAMEIVSLSRARPFIVPESWMESFKSNYCTSYYFHHLLWAGVVLRPQGHPDCTALLQLVSNCKVCTWILYALRASGITAGSEAMENFWAFPSPTELDKILQEAMRIWDMEVPATMPFW